MRRCKKCGHVDMSQREKNELRQIRQRAPLYARDLATLAGLSISNASNRLKKWCDRGFLMKREEAQQSGGIVFQYLATPGKVE